MKYISDIPRTAMEVYQMLPEGTLCEVIDNTLYMSQALTTDHQRILVKLIAKISNSLIQVEAGEIFVSPCDVYLDQEENVVQPDLIFISAANSAIVKKKGIYGAPDLLIEILSTNIHHDKKRKLAVYERNGVAEYIIIDPDTKENWHYILDRGKYQQVASEQGQISIRQLSLQITL